MSDARAIRILLLQLGTPAAPDTRSVRRYLREFLSDRRVVDLPRLLWLAILHGIVLRTRPARSARAYRKIWTDEGSPLAVIAEQQARALEAELGAAHGPGISVRVAMRYGQPSIAQAVRELESEGITRVLAFPMYPQYAGATTGSSLERLYEELGRQRVVPSVRVVPPYYDAPDYIDALRARFDDALPDLNTVDRVLFSFHGLPVRYCAEGDPYADQCRNTVDAFLTRVPRAAGKATTTFQSRFGREEWLQPFTDATLMSLARNGASVAVACPGFTADCLETLEEIAMAGRTEFEAAGGRGFTVVPCLNDHPAWITAMTQIAQRELGGWIDRRS